MAQIAARKLRARELPLTLARGRAQALPFPDETFDGVVSTFPAEFILERATVEEAIRVLRPGGRFVVVVNARLTGRDLLSRFLDFLTQITLHSNTGPDELLKGLSARCEKVQGDGWVATVYIGEKVH
jgi:ubiquinone/menaquinone biosynthesis C-methylase UbiE